MSAKISGKTYKCTVTVVNPKLSKTKVTLQEGKSTTLKVNGGRGAIKWTTVDKKIATVNSKGKITAQKAGVVKVTATCNGKKLNCIVTVRAKPKATPVPTPTKKPVSNATPTNTPKPDADSSEKKETDYGYQRDSKSAIVYYKTKEEIPYVFATTKQNPYEDNRPQRAYTHRRWVVSAPNVYRISHVVDKRFTLFVCGRCVNWDFTLVVQDYTPGFTSASDNDPNGFRTTDWEIMDKHMDICNAGNWWFYDIPYETHIEHTYGGHWQYYWDDSQFQ